MAAPLPATAMLALILAALGISAAVNWPGHLSYDSVLQLAEGRSGVYANWHPPVMSWLLGITDALYQGTGLFLLVQTALIYGAMLAFATAGGLRSWAAPALLVLFAAMPQGLSYPGTIWKDVLFAGANLAGFSALALAARAWARPGHRAVWLAVAGLLLTLAALARQNGILIVPFAALALGGIAANQGPRVGRGARAIRFGSGGLIVMALVIFLGHALLGLRITPGMGPGAQFQELEAYDLTGALRIDPRLPLPVLAQASPRFVALMRKVGVRDYSPQRIDTLTGDAELSDAMGAVPRAAMAAQWRDLIRSHPGLYLKTRWAPFRWLLLTPDVSRCVPFLFGVDGPPETMHELGYVRRWDTRDQALNIYSRHFLGTPVLSHGFWAAVAVLALLAVLRRRRATDLAVAGMLLGVLAFTASFFVISIACDYRYLYALDLSAMAAAIYLAADWRSVIAGRSGSRYSWSGS